jgi:surfactin synthase thioesterase subunit
VVESGTLLNARRLADLRACPSREYYSEERLSCPITVYGGLQDRDISLESLGAWEEQTSADCKLRMFPGDHLFLLSPEAGFVDVFQRDAVSILGYPAQASETPPASVCISQPPDIL